MHTQGLEHHPLVPNQYRKGGPSVKGLRGCGLVVGGKMIYLGFPSRLLFGKMPCWDGILPRKGSRWLDHLIHTIEVSGEVAQVLIDSGKEGKAYSKIKQIEILSWNE